MQTPDWTAEAAWASTRLPVESATGLNPGAYVDADFFAMEQDTVFERAWVCVGIAADAVVGRLLVRELGNRSILITRNAEGELRGFLNSCRHRGTELAEEDCDIAGTIRCPYHRWGYSTEGTLISTPLFNEVPKQDFDTANLGLQSVRVETWGCLLFACLDASTPPLLEWLGDLPDRMAGYRLGEWVTGWFARSSRSRSRRTGS